LKKNAEKLKKNTEKFSLSKCPFSRELPMHYFAEVLSL
jgi:hypothetical protein